MSRWSRQTRQRGAVLLMALFFILLISVLVVKILDELTMQIRAQAVQVARDDLRYVGLSAFETTMAVLSEIEEIDGGLHGPAQGWADPLAYAETITWPDGVTVAVTITDESGKFSLQEADPKVLNAFFEMMGIDYGDAETMTDSLLDWMDEDDDARLNGAESRYYEGEEPPLTPPNAPLKSWESLRYIQGFKELFFDENGIPNDYHRRFTKAFSLHTTSDPNVNTAPTDVLETLYEMHGFDVDYFLDYREGTDRVGGTDDDIVFREKADLQAGGFQVDGLPVGYDCTLLKVEVRVNFGEKAYLLSALTEVESSQGSGSGDRGEGDQQGAGGGRQNASSGSGTDYPFTITRLTESLEIN